MQRIEWTGADATAYQQEQAKWDAAVRDINQILNDIGTAVGIARENYLSTERSNAQACNRAYRAPAAKPTNLPVTTRGQPYAR